MRTRVVNIRTAPYDVYIGRPGHGLEGPFGNPLKMGQRCPACSTRDEANYHQTRASLIACYEKNILRPRMLQEPGFAARVLALRGKTLGCFCAPLPCHGDAILRVLADEEFLTFMRHYHRIIR